MSNNPQNQTVLLVEDDISLNKAFATMLSKQGYRVLVAFNGKEALEVLDESEVDLVLLDLLMPEMSGKDFLKAYKPKGKKPLIYVFSNLDSRDDINEVQELGADRYLLKSWATPKEFVRIVGDALSSD